MRPSGKEPQLKFWEVLVRPFVHCNTHTHFHLSADTFGSPVTPPPRLYRFPAKPLFDSRQPLIIGPFCLPTPHLARAQVTGAAASIYWRPPAVAAQPGGCVCVCTGARSLNAPGGSRSHVVESTTRLQWGSSKRGRRSRSSPPCPRLSMVRAGGGRVISRAYSLASTHPHPFPHTTHSPQARGAPVLPDVPARAREAQRRAQVGG